MRYTRNLILTGNPGQPGGLPFLFLALPVMDEPELLRRLLNCISVQSYRHFKLVVCVNQPESWWDDSHKVIVCQNNEESLRLLSAFQGIDIEVIDRSSVGNGWTGKRHGVGYARKTLMDRINEVAGPGDVIVSFDADSFIAEDYLGSIARNFRDHPGSAALALPYFHPAPPDASAARAMLRYEIYMRHYFLNLHRIGSPYAFTALGSAMALPVRAYRAIGGMTPKLSGEDFYFLQKLRKYGEVLLWNDELVYPEARFSDRVFFGTGPAMIKGATGDWSSYPIYPLTLFDEMLETYRLIPEMFRHPVDTNVTRFLSSAFREDDVCLPLRLNHKDPEHFTRAFHEKFDGLRILQYLKSAKESDISTDEKNLWEFLNRFYPGKETDDLGIDQESFSFTDSPVDELEKIRIFLFETEMKSRFTSAPR